MSVPKNYTNSFGKTYTIAPFWRRMFAFVLDSLLIIFMGLFVAKFLEANLYLCFVHVKEASEAYIHYNIVKRIMTDEFSMFFIIGLPYHVVAEQSSWLGSPAKYLFGQKVVDKEGNKPSFWQSLLRNLFKFSILVFIPFLFWYFISVSFIVWVIILIVAANDKYNRFLSDFPTQSFVLLRKK